MNCLGDNHPTNLYGYGTLRWHQAMLENQDDSCCLINSSHEACYEEVDGRRQKVFTRKDAHAMAIYLIQNNVQQNVWLISVGKNHYLTNSQALSSVGV